jgi:hypothetical protein
VLAGRDAAAIGANASVIAREIGVYWYLLPRSDSPP